jgi:ribonuclease HI
MADGIVLYTDGSFRQNKAGWGVHGYTYTDVSMKTRLPQKQQPTSSGYKDVPADETCTVINYIDAYGAVLDSPTNNTAELSAVINGFEIAQKSEAKALTFLMDSEYVRKGLTGYVQKWIKNGWIKADGNPVANRGYWEKLLGLKNQWTDSNRPLELQWVKGHSGDLGNDKADENSVLGGGTKTAVPKEVQLEADSVEKLKKTPVHPLMLESRLMFSVTQGPTFDGYYHMYNLGRSHNYGSKPRDTKVDKLMKADLLHGRRISDATFGVFKPLAAEPYLEDVIALHNSTYASELDQLGILNLSTVYNKNVRQKIETMGLDALQRFDEIKVLATPDFTLVSRTLDPPRLAHEALSTFGILRRQLDEFMSGETGESVDVLDVTDSFFETVTEGKKTISRLLKTITSSTAAIEIPVVHKGHDLKLRLVLSIDIPTRNQLARIGTAGNKVTLLVTATGPIAYSYSIVFTSDDGSAIYASPYTQFILPKKQVSHED